MPNCFPESCTLPAMSEHSHCVTSLLTLKSLPVFIGFCKIFNHWISFLTTACLIPVKQSPANKKIIIILENLEKSSLSELLGDFLGPLENRSTESPCTFQKGKDGRETMLRSRLLWDPSNLSVSQSTCYASWSSFFHLFELVPYCGLLRLDCCFWFVSGNRTSECYYFHENCFLLGTIAKACLQGSDLLVQQHFRWVQLRWDGEPMQGLLQRFLRRKVVNKVTNHRHSLLLGEGPLVSGDPGLSCTTYCVASSK